MKLYLTAVLLSALFVFAGCSKNDNSTTPSQPDPNGSPDISVDNFVQTPTGGDVRGVYAPNNPVFNIFTNPPSGTTVSTSTEISTATGTVTFDGSTPTSGNYNASNLSVFIQASATISAQGQSETIPILFSSAVAKDQGTWQVISDNKLVLDGQDTISYAVNDKGMFWIIPLIADSLGSSGQTFGSAVIALKK